MASSVFGETPGEAAKTAMNIMEKYRRAVNKARKAAAGKKLRKSKGTPKASPRSVKAATKSSPVVANNYSTKEVLEHYDDVFEAFQDNYRKLQK